MSDEEVLGHTGNRPWPPTSRTVEHDPACLHDVPGPGGHVCDLGCLDYINWVESYWEGFDAAREDVVPRVVSLWNRTRGWIPGANYKLLADALQVDESELWHWDPEQKAHVLNGERVL